MDLLLCWTAFHWLDIPVFLAEAKVRPALPNPPPPCREKNTKKAFPKIVVKKKKFQ